MNFRLIITTFFTISIIFTAIHEMEHIQNHESSSCQVCVVNDHLVSGDITVDFKDIDKIIFDYTVSVATLPYFLFQNQTNQTRAPPQHI